MRKEASLPVRLNPDEKRRLQEIADREDTNVSALIRRLVRTYVEYYEQRGGDVSMRPKWDEILVEGAPQLHTAAEKPISYLNKRTRAKKA